MTSRRRAKRRANFTRDRNDGKLVSIHKLVLSTAKLQALPQFDRYVFALLGHIFNDLMISQKLSHISRVHPRESHQYIREGGVGVSLFFLRTLAARTKEVMETLTDKRISNHIETKIFAPAGLENQWRGALKLFNKIDHDWLATVRNAHAFHYMREHQFLPYLKSEYCDHAHALVGRKYGDTFFTWSDIRAGHAMLDQVDSNDPFAGLGRMLDDLGELLGKLGDCIAQGLQRYIADQLTDPGALQAPQWISAPDFNSFYVPYFFRTRRL